MDVEDTRARLSESDTNQSSSQPATLPQQSSQICQQLIKKFSKLTVVIIILFCLTGSLIAGYLIYRNSQLRQRQQKVGSNETSQVSTPKILDTNTWKTYKHTFYTIKFPDGWFPYRNTVSNYDYNKREKLPGDFEKKTIEFYSLDEPEFQYDSWEKLREEVSKFNRASNIEEVLESWEREINGKKVIYQYSCNKNKECIVQAYIDADYTILRAISISMLGNEASLNIFNTIVQTIEVEGIENWTKIISRPVDTSSWLSHKNNSGFSLKYPPTWDYEEGVRYGDMEEPKTYIFTLRDSPDYGAYIQKHHTHFYISSDSGYLTTAGNVCNNQGCENFGLFQVEPDGNTYLAKITKAFSVIDDEDVFDYYGLVLTFGDIELHEPGSSSLGVLNVTAIFQTLEEGQEIANILSTIKKE